MKFHSTLTRLCHLATSYLSSFLCVTIYRAAPVVTVEAEIITLEEPLVLNDQSYQCIVEGGTTVSCFNVSVCFNYSLLPGDSVERFSKTLAVYTIVTHIIVCGLNSRNVDGTIQGAICIYYVIQ